MRLKVRLGFLASVLTFLLYMYFFPSPGILFELGANVNLILPAPPFAVGFWCPSVLLKCAP